MEMLVIAAAVAVASGFAFAIALRTYRLWRAGMDGAQPLLMNRMLEHEGASLAGRTDESMLVQMGNAARGCLMCRHQATCRAWLEGRTAASLQAFCPNAELIRRLKSGRPAAR